MKLYLLFESFSQQWLVQVLRNIMAPIAKMTKSPDDPQKAVYHEYDFLAKKSRPPTFPVDDLDSVEVSQMIHEGMVFWGPEEPEVATAAEPAPVKEEKDDKARSRSVTSEEMTVETMLGVAEGTEEGTLHG
jgi:hypothetical protein